MLDMELPGREGVLKSPYRERFWDFEIVRPFNGMGIESILLNFYGTISHEQDPWPDWMYQVFREACQEAKFDGKEKKIRQAAIDIILRTMGAPTYVQFKEWTDHIKKETEVELDPQKYLAIYQGNMREEVEKRRAGNNSYDLLVPGAREIIKEFNVKIASGSGRQDLLDSIRYLNLSKHIPDESVCGASTEYPGECAKARVAAELAQRGSLLVIGKNPWEMQLGYKSGVSIGLAMPKGKEHESRLLRGHLTPERHRQMLIDGGAHIITRNLMCYYALIRVAMSHYPLEVMR